MSVAAIISRTDERFWFVRVLNEDLVAVSRHDEGLIVRGVCEVAQRGHRAVFPDTHVFRFDYCLRQFGRLLESCAESTLCGLSYPLRLPQNAQRS